jgi:hypothetical protein
MVDTHRIPVPQQVPNSKPVSINVNQRARLAMSILGDFITSSKLSFTSELISRDKIRSPCTLARVIPERVELDVARHASRP